MPKLLKKDKLDEDLSLVTRLDMADFPAAESHDRKVISQAELSQKGLREDILAQAKAEAAEIKERAKALYLQVEDKVRAAREKGHAEGREEGLASVTKLLTEIRQNNVAVMAGLEKESLRLIFEIATRIIGESFKAGEEALLGMVRQVLSASLGNELTVLLNPQDFERVKGSQSQLMSALHGSQILKLRPAETVKPNSCVIESEMGTIEANLDSQLKAIKTALGLVEE